MDTYPIYLCGLPTDGYFEEKPKPGTYGPLQFPSVTVRGTTVEPAYVTLEVGEDGIAHIRSVGMQPHVPLFTDL